jgi:hypothetical protein
MGKVSTYDELTGLAYDDTFYVVHDPDTTPVPKTIEASVAFSHIQGAPAASPTLGSNLITNGDFAAGDTDWTVGANWSTASGAAVHSTGATAALTSAAVTTTSGAHYLISFKLTRSAGTLVVTLSGGGESHSFVGTVTDVVQYKSIKAASASNSIVFTPDTNFAGSVDDVTVQLLTARTENAIQLYDSSGVQCGVKMHPGGGALENVFIGEDAGEINTVGTYNVGIGYEALEANTVGVYNVGIGYQALKAATNADNNVAIGKAALTAATTGGYNIAIGRDSLMALSTGTINVAIGYSAAKALTTASNVVAVGNSAAQAATAGSQITSVGSSSLVSASSGSSATAFGYRAGAYYGTGTSALATCTQSVFVGADSRALANGSTNEIVIGYNALGGGSNTATLGATTITATFLQGNVTLNTEAARSIAVARHATADTAGIALTVQAGGATSGATDKAGGGVVVSPGLSTGSAESGVTLRGCPAGGAGTTDGTLTDMVAVLGNKLGFFGATPVVKQAYTAVSASPTQAEVTAIRDALINLGLMAAS